MEAAGGSAMSAAVLTAAGLEKTYPALSSDAPGVELFRDLSLEVSAGEMVAIVGESGAGKSSLLHLLAALDSPSAGKIVCNGKPVSGMSPKQAAAYRNHDIGYVWQFHYLLPEFTALENIAMPLLSRGVSHAEAMSKAALWLARVELSGRGQHRAGELSGGEQQRISIARALVTDPRVLLADEPTGDLDGPTAERVFTLLRTLQREHELAAVLVTHNLEFASRCDRVLRLKQGQLSPA
jgi:lipoprotein-releasing system ATP-binding protein